MHVLIVKTSSMGDILQTLPALTDATYAIPSIKFDWVVEEGFSEIPSWHPAVDRVIPVAIRRWRKNWFHAATRQERYRFKKEIQCRTYNAIIDAQGLIKSAALITRIAKGPLHGQDYRSAREPLASWFFNHKHSISKTKHAVERMCELFALSLEYNQPKSVKDYGISKHFFKYLTKNCGYYLVFVYGTTRNYKYWPENNWRQLISLIHYIGIKIKLPWGTKIDHQQALRLADGFEHVEVLPRLSLHEIAIIIAGARAVVSVDTGLSHLAAALDIPNITIYGQTDPKLIGAYGNNQVACCSINKNIKDLSPDMIVKLLLIYITT
ncbi:lipopolysaccharide heptosyltransferase RfaC [Candidatus Profftia sp. (ex Adelges kitamiensis)]|uniref:lipopolysaccharide heptosyltransferase RfaC n=1 Tax=Candidatus Profftia sp. (ex Adelges kitamiensis) TaxID=2864218 RepID=UPI001CE2BD29|nr:lipopolysaccharide heptosyltransferase RfaC [Candidatus Profftia sp. (ex Adelges kitamiensis)]